MFGNAKVEVLIKLTEILISHFGKQVVPKLSLMRSRRFLDNKNRYHLTLLKNKNNYYETHLLVQLEGDTTNSEQFDKLVNLGFDLEQKVGGFNFYEQMIMLGKFDLLCSPKYIAKTKKFTNK